MKNKKMFKGFVFVMVAMLFMGLAFTMADFYKMPFESAKDMMLILAQFVVVEVAVSFLLWFVCCNRYVFAFVFPIMSVVCSIVAYFRYTAQISLTATTIDLALVNDMRTSMDVVTLPMLLFLLLCFLVSLVFVYVRFRWISFRHSFLQMALSGILLYIYINIPAISLPVRSRIPFTIYTAFVDYFANRRIVAENRPPFAQKAQCQSDSIDVVFILGETLRAKNMQINGYKRPTTPCLMKESNLVSLPNIYSEYGFTHNSVPYLLTRASHENPNLAYQERSFIDIFKRAGFFTTWISNQESVDTFVYFMNEADSLIYVNNGKSVYVYDLWLDGDVLPVLDEQLKSPSSTSGRKLMVIHTIGSHWWYNAHYSRNFALWKPELKSKVFSSNTKEEFYNSYDNTVCYSDYFWQEVRNRFRRRNAIVIYLSDHGENLGENGIYGHGEDAEPLHYPGCWIWMSDIYKAKHHNKWKALLRNKDKHYNSAFLFHSILDAADIITPYVDKKYDVFSNE